MLSNDSKIRILEGFYGLDYLFFDKKLTEMKGVDIGLVEEYLVLKSALSSIMIEMMRVVDHKPKKMNYVTAKQLLEVSHRDADAAKKICKSLVLTENGKDDIKVQINEALQNRPDDEKDISISEIVREEVERKAVSLAIDTLLIAKLLQESERYQALNESHGRLLESSYKTIRDSLIEIGMEIKKSQSNE